MTTFGQLCLLAAFVASGYAAFACFVGWRAQSLRLQRVGGCRRRCRRPGADAGQRDPRRGLVVTTISVSPMWPNTPAGSLPWHYALSAFWVGQAGSLLLWAWSVGVLAMIYRFWPRRTLSPLREPAFAILMAYQCFLVAIMVFGADPMQPSLAVPREGGGLEPGAATSGHAAAPAGGVPRLCRLRDSLCPGRRGAA